MLPFGQFAERRQEHRDVAFLLSLHDRGGMLARRGEVGTA
jgi:hypothetical protein